MRTFINWNQLIFRVLFCVLCVFGYAGIVMIGLALMPRPPDNSDKISSPIKADLSYYKIQISRDGIVTIPDIRFSSDEEIGPMQVLSAALKKYPNAKKFKMNWSLNVGSS